MLGHMVESIIEPQQAYDLYPATTGIVCIEEHQSNGQHRLDARNLAFERLVFPGGGFPYDSCGSVRAQIFCVDEDKWLYDLLEHCDRPECPICSDKWLKRASSKATEQIIQVLNLAKEETNAYLSLSEVVVSVPSKLWDCDIDTLWQRFRGRLRYLGTRDVAGVIHLFRFRDSANREVQWKVYLADPTRYHVVREPHFHCVVMGKLVKSNVFFKLSGGWVYKKLGKRLQRTDVYNIVHYALSHTQVSLDKQRQLIRYYGLFKKAQIASKTIEHEAVLCPDCEGPTERRYLAAVMVEGVPVLGYCCPHTHTIITRTWRLPRGIKKRDVNAEGEITVTVPHVPLLKALWCGWHKDARHSERERVAGERERTSLSSNA